MRTQEDEIVSLKARVGELERVLLDACREKMLHGHTTTLLTESLRLKVPGIEGFETWGEERESKLRMLEADCAALDKLRHDYKCALEKSDADLMMVRCERDALRAQVEAARRWVTHGDWHGRSLIEVIDGVKP